MVTIQEILTVAKQMKASDVHITVGIPPKVRVHGALTNMNYPVLTKADADAIIKSTMNERQLAILEDKGEVDFSFSIHIMYPTMSFSLKSTYPQSPKYEHTTKYVYDVCASSGGLFLAISLSNMASSDLMFLICIIVYPFKLFLFQK